MKIPSSHERTISEVEAKANPHRLFKDAKRGITTIVTRHGEPLAKIVPADAEVRSNIPFDFDAFMERTRAIRERSKPGPESMHDLINEGRR